MTGAKWLGFCKFIWWKQRVEEVLMEEIIQEALNKGVEMHVAGEFDLAGQLYESVMKLQPDHADANHNTGLLKLDMGNDLEALPYLQTALQADTTIAQFWISYIKALIKLDRRDEAARILNLATESGIEGEEIVELNQVLNSSTWNASVVAAEVDKPSQSEPNILDSMKLDQALRLAEKVAKEGDAEEVKRIYKDILAKFPQNKRAQQGLAALDKPKQSPPQETINQLINLYNQGQLAAVVEQANILTAQYPDAFSIWNILGAAAAKTGQTDNAFNALKRVIDINPDLAEAYNNMGIALQQQGKLDEAIASYSKALSLKPNYGEAYNNMGVALKEQGKLDEAIASYNKALSLKPDYAEAYNNMGNALKDQGKLDEAIVSYNKALSLKPDYADVYNNMGFTLQEQGNLDEAIASYNKALSVKPDYAEAWSNGAETLEKWNKLKELGLWFERAFQILDPVPSDLLFFKAKLLWRNKDTQEATKLISNIDVETLKPIRQQGYFHLKAKCYEASKDYNLAFTCFENMNSLAIKSNDYLGLDHESYFQSIRDQLAILNSNSFKKPANNITEQTGLVPVFLVGFPRSGTTLLDTILRSHSSIDVVEEQPLVSSAKAFVEKSGYPEIAQALPKEVISGARKAYITELDKHREPKDNKSILIDKLPLNLVQIPFIQQLYPQAKFILALRHPLDTILSCWMQNFKLNSAMANMVELDRIVEFYCVAMETFKICRAKYNLSFHQIKYEDLLEDLSGETSALLKFLDLDWEDQMKNYQKTALNRGRIKTPSYSQVVQPIYKDAKYRWLNYEKHLRQYITQVEPWINEFGYSNH